MNQNAVSQVSKSMSIPPDFWVESPGVPKADDITITTLAAGSMESGLS
jgi:hypothetical protein